METTRLKELRELRAQEKKIADRILAIKPLALEEAKFICPEGGKFTVEGLGDFVLDKDPLLPIDTSRAKEAVAYRQHEKERAALRAQASAESKTMTGLYNAFKKRFAASATDFAYEIRCLGV